MRIVDCEQGSWDWLEARAGIPTASEFDRIISPTGKIRTGETPKKYLAEKLAEWWVGGPLPSFSAVQMEYGEILESEAKPAFSFKTGLDIQTVGLVLTDDGRVGCSPDGLIGDDNGIEIKCPSRQVHVGYLLGETLPEEHLLQVQGAMYVTGRPKWTFVSYCRCFPMFVVYVERDERILSMIAQGLDAFLALLDDAKSRLVARYGPRPARPLPKQDKDIEWPDWMPE
jgi:hypothetical protein